MQQMTEEMREFFRKQGKKGSRIQKKKVSHADLVKWGKRGSQRMSAEARRERARKAGLAGAKARKQRKQAEPPTIAAERRAS